MKKLTERSSLTLQQRMTTSLSFMFQGLEKRVLLENVETSATFGQIIDLLHKKMEEENIPIPEGTTNTRLICFGKVMKMEDEVKNVANPYIEPPYTVQVIFRKDEPELQSEDSSCCSSGQCLVQ